MNPLARLVFPALRWRSRTGFAHERRRIDRLQALGVGGYILFGGKAEASRSLVEELQANSPHPLLIGSDFERGVAQQFGDMTHLPPPAALGFLGRGDMAARCGQITAREARYTGVNWVYAPVADLDNEPRNPIIQTRSFGDQPGPVGELVAAWVGAAESEGVATSAKHFPGHGRTVADSHDTLPSVETTLAELETTDLLPFAAALRAGTRSVMSAHVAYPRWDPSGRPASLSSIVLDHLRQSLGFDGVVVTDALIMEGALRGRGPGAASVAAIAAGNDALLYPSDAELVVRALDRASTTDLPRARLDDALGRVARLAAGLARRPAPRPDLADHAAYADALADLTLHVLRGETLTLEPPFGVTVIDDDVGGPYTVGPRDLLTRRLRESGVPLGGGGTRMILVYAEPRSWKGRALLGGRSLEALSTVAPEAGLVVLFGHPRLAAQIPGDAPILGAWHGQPLMQYAVARWVLARLGGK